MGKRLNNLFFVVGITAIVIMFCTFDASLAQLWDYVTKAGYWLAAILGLWVLLYALNAFAWRIIIEGSGPCTVGYARLMQLTVTGFALNYTTPVGLVGGEAYRIMELSKYLGVRRATSSVVLYAMTHIFAHFWFWVSGILLYLWLAVLGHVPLTQPIGWALGFATVFCAAGIYLFIRGYRHGMVVKTIRLAGKIPGLRSWARRFTDAHLDDLERIDRQIAELQGQNKHSFYGSLLLEYVGRVCQCFEIFFMLLLLEEGTGNWLLTFAHSFLILALTSLFANLLGFLPLQLGGREGGFAMSVALLGMNAGVGMFIGVISRVRELFWASAGLIAMKIGRAPTRCRSTRHIT